MGGAQKICVTPAEAGAHGPFGKLRGRPSAARRRSDKGLGPRRRSVNLGRQALTRAAFRCLQFCQ